MTVSPGRRLLVVALLALQAAVYSGCSSSLISENYKASLMQLEGRKNIKIVIAEDSHWKDSTKDALGTVYTVVKEKPYDMLVEVKSTDYSVNAISEKPHYVWDKSSQKDVTTCEGNYNVTLNIRADIYDSEHNKILSIAESGSVNAQSYGSDYQNERAACLRARKSDGVQRAYGEIAEGLLPKLINRIVDSDELVAGIEKNKISLTVGKGSMREPIKNGVIIVYGSKDIKQNTSKPAVDNPFGKVEGAVQDKIDRYLTPRVAIDVRSQVPLEIVKPDLPKAPTLLKSDFETKADFEKRVSSAMDERNMQIKGVQEKYRRDVEARNQKIEQLKKAYESDIAAIKQDQENKKAKLPEKIIEFTREAFIEVMGSPVMENPVYDAETETMQVDFRMSNAKYNKRVDLKVPRTSAQAFHDSISMVVPLSVFMIEDQSIKLKEIKAIYKQKQYAATLTEKQFQPEKIEVALKDTKVDFKADQQANLKLQNPNLIDTYRVSSITYGESASASGKSYVDDLKPLLANIKQKPSDPKKWLFMIAVEHYNDADPVTFAKSSAEAFRDTAQKVFGIDQQHTIALIDEQATTAAFTLKLNYLLEQLIKDGDTIFFYYSGHGVPDNKSTESFILPKDAIPDYVAKDEQFQLTRIYKRMTDSKAGKIVAFVDACFSGKTDAGQLFKGTAPALSRTKKVSFDESKMAILAAARDDQFANAYDDKGHRMFSYFVIKGLLSGRDNLDSLYKDVSLNVHDVSKLKGQARLQDPQLIGNKNIGL